MRTAHIQQQEIWGGDSVVIQVPVEARSAPILNMLSHQLEHL